jgi:hypothetical protein
MPDDEEVTGEGDDRIADDGDDGITGRWLRNRLDWAYDRAIQGLPPVWIGAEELASQYRKNYPTPELAIDALTNWTSTEAGLVGFATGIGGVAILPAALPANIASILAIQLRLAVAIACLRGYDVHDHETNTFALATLLGNGAVAALEEAGVRIGARLTANLIAQIPGSALRAINRTVGMRLITRFGTTGVFNLSKCIPIVGGLVGAGVDSAATYGLAQAAKSVFPTKASEFTNA